MIRVVVIVTAAGMSTRNPPNKLLIRLDDESVIEKTVGTFTQLPVQTVVVLGYQGEIMQPLLENRFGDTLSIVHNPEYTSGIAGSVRVGVQSIEPGTVDYYAFCNGDRPFIKAQTVTYLLSQVDALRPLIAIPTFLYEVGHPTFFAGSLRDELLQVTGDLGGRPVIERHRDKVLNIPVDDEGITIDMDQYIGTKRVG